MVDAFHHGKENVTKFYVIPFDGSAPQVLLAKHAFTFNHVVNAYQNGSGVVFDAVSFQDAKLWLTAGLAFMNVQTDKALRDATRSGIQEIWRYVLHLQGPFIGA